ncbi:hypothetical protein DERP_004737 [Dermatophagoides pteronyssinus]|uniref:Uncharacterized protein n=1 Tax=Dermatophagoides pteronyssinus TaxID=6956 RepID=A0ABQ8JPL8_DERPT|nr:hypothetical protein DERP_004737 [Dermatophagoides pteronyssinus]
MKHTLFDNCDDSISLICSSKLIVAEFVADLVALLLFSAHFLLAICISSICFKRSLRASAINFSLSCDVRSNAAIFASLLNYPKEKKSINQYCQYKYHESNSFRNCVFSSNNKSMESSFFSELSCGLHAAIELMDVVLVAVDDAVVVVCLNLIIDFDCR